MVTNVKISVFQVIHKKEPFRVKHLKDQHPHLLKELKFTKFRLTVATSKVLSQSSCNEIHVNIFFVTADIVPQAETLAMFAIANIKCLS